jgi:4-amino-4-deoxy-L-arabinose transferase-like glycosyltransferase
VATRTGLMADEAYYWEWSRRLALAYFDHPPMVAYLIRLSTGALGHGVLAVHLPAIVLGTLSALVLRRLVLELYPQRHGLAWAAALSLGLVPLFALGQMFTTPDAPLVFFSLCTLSLLHAALNGRPAAWYGAGLGAGLALLSKFNALLLVLAAVLYLVASREHRGWLRRAEPYLALLVAAAFTLPIVVWNWQHGWVSLSFQFVERHRRDFTPALNITRLVASQLTLSPQILLLCLFGGGYGLQRARAGDAAARWLLWFGGGVVGFFAIAGIFTLTLANWFEVGWVLLLVLGLAGLSTTRPHRAVAWAAVVSAGVLTVLVQFQAATQRIPVPRWFNYTLEAYGWDAVGARLRQLLAASPEPRRTFVFSRRFQYSAEAAFVVPEATITRLGGRRDQYDLWRRPAELAGADAVFLCDDEFPAGPPSELFERCQPAGELPITVGSRTVRTFRFWRCLRFDPARLPAPPGS